MNYILDQKDQAFAGRKFGAASLSHGGCGAVAVYNLLCTLGQQPNLDQILEQLRCRRAPLLMGFLGTLPRRLLGYLQELGYDAVLSREPSRFDDLARSADGAILWYTWHRGLRFGIHFFHLRPVPGGYLAYNLYSGQRAPVHIGKISDFLRENTRFPARLITARKVYQA